MATNKIQTGIRFDPELLYKISYVAKDNKRSLNAQPEYLAQLCVKEYEAANGTIAVNDELLYQKESFLRISPSLMRREIFLSEIFRKFIGGGGTSRRSMIYCL